MYRHREPSHSVANSSVFSVCSCSCPPILTISGSRAPIFEQEATEITEEISVGPSEYDELCCPKPNTWCAVSCLWVRTESNHNGLQVLQRSNCTDLTGRRRRHRAGREPAVEQQSDNDYVNIHAHGANAAERRSSPTPRE